CRGSVPTSVPRASPCRRATASSSSRGLGRCLRCLAASVSRLRCLVCLFLFLVVFFFFFFFFFSSRRRHTRFSRDWSSDVCSSDLVVCDFLFYDFVDCDKLIV